MTFPWAAVGFFGVSLVVAQMPSSNLQFEVASLKPTVAGGPIRGIRPAPGGIRYEAAGCPVKLMIQVAYQLKAEQIVGGPAWMDTEQFDMNAKAARESSSDEMHAMLIHLLAERFHLRTHLEKKEMPIYALSVDKSGIKMTSHPAANGGDPWIDQGMEGIVHVKMKATSAPMHYFAFRLSQMMDRPVVDLTDLPGWFDFQLEYTRDLPPGIPENARLNGAPLDTSGPTVFAAVKRQLGLELKAQRGAADLLVIDGIDRLTEN